MFIAEPTSFAQHFKNSWPVLETSAQWLRGTLCNASLNATIQHVIFAVNPISCRNVDEDHGRSVQGGEKRDVSDVLTKVRNRDCIEWRLSRVQSIGYSQPRFPRGFQRKLHADGRTLLLSLESKLSLPLFIQLHSSMHNDSLFIFFFSLQCIKV